jgi:hypothetical protein
VNFSCLSLRLYPKYAELKENKLLQVIIEYHSKYLSSIECAMKKSPDELKYVYKIIVAWLTKNSY